MTPEDLVKTLGVLGATAAAALGGWATWRRVRPDLLSRTLGDLAAETVRRRESEAARDRALQESVDMRRTLDHERGELDLARARLRLYETGVPALAVELDRLSTDLCSVLDRIPCPVAISLPAEEGRLAWVNRDFCEALGRTREDILALGWRRLVRPADLLATEDAETRAHLGPVEVVNEYLHMDGSWVCLRWFATRYLPRVAFSVIRIEGEGNPVVLRRELEECEEDRARLMVKRAQDLGLVGGEPDFRPPEAV